MTQNRLNQDYVDEVYNLSAKMLADSVALADMVRRERADFNNLYDRLQDEALEKTFMPEFEGFLAELTKQEKRAEELVTWLRRYASKQQEALGTSYR